MSSMDDAIRAAAGRPVTGSKDPEVVRAAVTDQLTGPTVDAPHTSFDGGARESVPPARSMDQFLRDGFDALRATRSTHNSDLLGG